MQTIAELIRKVSQEININPIQKKLESINKALETETLTEEGIDSIEKILKELVPVGKSKLDDASKKEQKNPKNKFLPLIVRNLKETDENYGKALKIMVKLQNIIHEKIYQEETKRAADVNYLLDPEVKKLIEELKKLMGDSEKMVEKTEPLINEFEKEHVLEPWGNS